MTFVKKIAQYIYDENVQMEHLTLVLPSERMKKHLSAELFDVFGKPILAPEMVTMSQWVKSHSKHTIIDSTRVLIRLFEIHIQIAESEQDRSFDEFMLWGNTLLADFNEIDRYLLDAKQIFRNLADIKEIENWSFGEAELTVSQKRFMEFWDRLPGYYFELEKQLSQRGQCYMGQAYRYLAQHIDVLFKSDDQAQYLFAGFNALSPSEISIIRQVENLGRAHILIDADVFYFQKKSHEAGSFLRNLSLRLDDKKLNFIQDQLQSKSLQVDLIECTQSTGQVKAAATLLDAMEKDEIDQTLLLLGDETLISSVVKNLPKNIGKANITLGLPIRNTAIKTWVELLFSVQENKRRFKTQASYFSDLQNLWSHPFVLAVLSNEQQDSLIEIEREIIQMNRIFINALKLGIRDENFPNRPVLDSNAMEIIECVCLDWNDDWKQSVRTIRKLNQLIYSRLEPSLAFERAVLECFDAAMIEFENLVLEGIPEMGLKSYKQLFNQHWTQKSIAYYGTPMDGLQIMGLLETRGLDFKRIIALGMNEGNLPPTNPIQTMIPMDLRRYYGMPTPREKQGLFGHHFYRLLHSCEHLTATFCSAVETIGSSEISRYLMQLEMELARRNPKININKSIYALDSPKESTIKEIAKTPEIFDRMDDLFASSTSSSMLKKYLDCSLDFYFKYIMDFSEAESIEEEIEQSTLGTFIHDTLEELYLPFARFNKEGIRNEPPPKNLTSFDIEEMLKTYPLVLEHKFTVHFNGDKEAFTKGKNLLSYQMAKELTGRFLKEEVAFISKQREPVFIEALERKYTAEIEVEVQGVVKKVNLTGYVDRIDSIGDRIRIIDYKTGKVDKSDVSLRKNDTSDELVVESIGNKKHILQLMLYSFLYHHNEGKVAEPSIVSFVSGNHIPFDLDLKSLDLNTVIESFPRYVQLILEELFDQDVSFMHRSKGPFSFCQYCE
jgi:hypothetical protein